MKTYFISIFVTALLFVSCSEENNPIIPSTDTIAPAAISDLVVGITTSNSAVLYFTAPGDDSLTGRARTYQVRYSTTIFDSTNYTGTSLFTYPISPNVGTIADTVLLTGLSANTKYYIGIITLDEASNASPLSNIDSATTLLTGSWTIYNTDNSEIASNNVLSVETNLATKYIATDGGVSVYDNTNWNLIYESRTMQIDTTYLVNDTIIDTTYLSTPNAANSIAVESASRIWIGTDISGVALLEGDSILFYTTHDSSSLLATKDILISQNKLWVGTSSSGLHSFTLDGSDTWEQFDVPINPSYPGNGKINCLEADANNAIWCGLQLIGTTVYQNSTFTNYSSVDNFTNQQVLDISSRGNRVLFGTDAGAFKYENSAFTKYTTADGLPDNVITAVAEDATGTFWFGTRFGLVSYTNSQVTIYTTSNSLLPDNYINDITVDAFGSLWIATQNGLARFTN